MGRPRLLARTAAFLLLAACTAGSGISSSQTPAPSIVTPSPVAIDPVPDDAGERPGTLLIRTPEGGLVTTAPDGTERRVLVDPSVQPIQVHQAVWSPDGDHVAWAQVDGSTGVPRSGLVVADASGEDRRETPLPVVPFYLAWDPTSSRVAFLGGAPPFTMGFVERRGETAATPLSRGAPLYFSWAPDGDRLVVHLGLDDLFEVRIDGTRPRALDRTGLFQAPVWSPDGETIVYVREHGVSGIGQIVARDVRSERVTPLAEIDGQGFIVLSPDGRRLAYAARGVDELILYGLSLPDGATDLGVRIIDLADPVSVVASDDPAIGWSWSPDGRRLAILEPVYGEVGVSFRWRVWTGGSSFTTEPFVGSMVLQDEMNFFTQFAQSASIWAPDSSAIAYPAETADGTAIFVQPLERGARPFAVGEGTWVAWSTGG